MDSFLDPIFSKIVEFLNTVFSSIISAILYNGFTRVSFALLFFNLLGFFLMYKDKKLAEQNAKFKEEHTDLDEKTLKKSLHRRISESSILITALIGGSIGVLLGMYKFKHKTRKPKFKIGVPLIIVIQIVFIVYGIIRTLISNNAS